MKELTKLMTMLMLLFLSVGFTACSSDDDDDNDNDVVTDVASRVVGTYVGTGTLSIGSIEIEKEDGMKITLSRSSNEFVTVHVADVSGRNYLQGEDPAYKVIMTADKAFMLTHVSNANAQITIDKNGNMVYINPNIVVTMDGTNYSSTLSFTGKKDR